jgi:transcriptional regulator with XRE-family HTH domain
MQELQALRDFRQANKLSRRELGERLGVDAMTIRRWEKGDNLPHRRFWEKIKSETGVSLDVLVTSEAAQ